MVKILVYHGKHDDMYFDISTPEKRQEAFVRLFNVLSEEGFYDESGSPTGNAKDIEKFLTRRSQEGYEYEEISERETEN